MGHPEVADLFQVPIDTGARLGELLKLRYEDIDYKRKTITFVDTKSGENRTIFMLERTREILKRRQGINDTMPFALKEHIHTKTWRRGPPGLFSSRHSASCHNPRMRGRNAGRFL